MKELKEGTKAPAFKLTNQDGDVIELKSIKEDFIVLFFYPKDNTPGCTIEAKGFSATQKQFKKASIAVFGISGGDSKSKVKFCEKAALSINLLSDTDGTVGEKYGSFGPKVFMGRKFTGFHRKTFIIGPDRKIIKIFDKVKPDGHAEEVLEFIKGIR